MAVDLSTVHHEGAGAPSDNVSRFSEGGYSYAIGATTWTRFRSPQSSWATLDFNHVSLDICLSGNRMDYPVTDNDLTLIHGAYLDCYQRGEVTAAPTVRPHKNSPGSSTVCPGDRTMAVWNEVAAAVRYTDTPQPQPPQPPPEDDVTDLANALNHDGRPCVFQVGGDSKLYFRIRDATGGTWGTWRDLSGGFKDFATVTAFANPTDQKIDVWVTMKDGKSFHRWQSDDFASWGSWQDVTR